MVCPACYVAVGGSVVASTTLSQYTNITTFIAIPLTTALAFGAYIYLMPKAPTTTCCSSKNTCSSTTELYKFAVLSISFSAMSIGALYLYNKLIEPSSFIAQGFLNEQCSESEIGHHTITLTKSSNVLGKDGNHIIASVDADNFFFSMCTTKKSATIENFNSTEDKIFIFCSKETILKPDVHFDEPRNITHILVQAAHGVTDIKLIGNHSEVEPILNIGFIHFCNGETPYWTPEIN